MNRKQAAIWAKLTKTELETLDMDVYANFHKEIKAFGEGKDIECFYCGEWEIEDEPIFFRNERYRVAIPEITVFGVKVRANPPRSVDKPPKVGESFWLLNLNNPGACTWMNSWSGDEYDKTNLKRGFVFDNKEDVVAVAKALGCYDVYEV